MATVLLPLQPGTLPQGYCFSTWQQLLIDFADNLEAILPGEAFYNYGDTKPAPEFESYPWLNTNDMRWYRFEGAWIANNPATSQLELRMFTGTLTDLQTYDGGDTDPASDRSGPMWEQAVSFTGRVPIGVGTVPGTTAPVVTTAVEDDIGEGQHVITAGEGAATNHIHPIGITNPASDDAFLPLNAVNTVAGYNGFYITGSASRYTQAQTTADLYTLPAGLDGAGVTGTPMSLIQPSRAVYFIKRTSRIYYKVA